MRRHRLAPLNMAIQDCKNYVLKLLVGTLFCQLTITDATITWTLPPPQRGPLLKSDTSVRTTIQPLINGSSEAYLTWNFTFSGEILDRVTFEIGGNRIGKKTSTGIVTIDPTGNFQEHFDISRSDPATLIIYNVTKADEALFSCKVETDARVWNDRIQVKIVERPELDYASSDQDVCEDSMVTLYCNATGEPEPNITWTRVWENGTDSEQLSVVDGSYVMRNINRTSNGMYRCTAYNGVGDPVNRTVKVIVGYSASVDRVVKSSDTVIEGDTFSLTCEVSGDPTPNVTWITVSDDEHSYGNMLNFTNIMRGDSGNYTCETENRCGKESRNESINVFYQPDMVTLVTNTTENKDCSDLWVNFTCISSEANPPVYNYLLSDDEDGFSLSKSGTWVTKVSRGGESIYYCLAFQLVENVTSTRNISLTVNVPASVEQVENKNVIEGGNVEEYCNVNAGNPAPVVMWTNVTSGEHIKGNPLNITSINQAQAGEYKCTANNTCGEASTVMNINVQYGPENVILTTNTTSKVCPGVVINFTCTAEANPPVHTYLLYENDTMIKNMGTSGTWIKAIKNAGHFVFRCKANNSIQGIGKSDDTTLTVDVPASVEQAKITNITEGDKVEVYCRVTAGIPDPTVMWTNVKTGEHIKENPLNITNINRTQTGNYKCIANNTCGEASTVMKINVQYGPENVILTTNTTSKDIVCPGVVINFTCTAEANPPVHTYLLYENDTMIKNMGTSGTWIKAIENAGHFVFRCKANNSIQGIGKSDDTTLTVDVPASVEQAKITNITEGDKVEVYCKVTAGIPDPTVMWTNVNTGEHIKENPLNITNINRTQAGEYKCIANNTCGEASTVMKINVQYPPDIVDISVNQTVNESDTVNLTCEADANPKASITWTRVSDNSSVTFPLTIFGKQDEGGYRCTAENSIQDPARKTFYIIVENHRPIKTELDTHVKSVNLNKTFNITCHAQANPAAKYRFYKNQENFRNDTSGNEVAVIATSVHERVLEVNYSCTPFNEFGDGPTDVISVSVLFPPFVIDGNRTEFVSQENCSVSISCPIHGNPAPNITWYKGNDSSTIISKASTLELSGTVCNQGGLYTYTCFAESHLGNVTVTLKVLVETPEPTTPSTPTTKESACSGFFQKEDCDINLVVIIVIAFAGLIVICIIVGIIAWWVHKRRKCRKDTRVHHSTSEERPFSRENSTPGDDNSYSQVNNGYAQAGPQSSEMASLAKHQEASGPATVPDYAVVDKSAKKGKKKEKKVEEQKLAAEPPQYAAVDKSKKKKKGEPDATYAQVDMSKKSKKKPKPGEVLYADLGDFQQMQELPAVSTSPQALPPIKKPAPYGETQYADITQFLKGDATLPESNNSQGPGTGTQAAPAPGNGNSQEPGTSTKETSQASNPGGDDGPNHETNF